jgi:membrane protein YdbS with pleckstrin-like domain
MAERVDKDKLARYLEFRPAWKSFTIYFFGVAVFYLGPLVNPQAPIGPALSEIIGSCFLLFIVYQRFTNLYQVRSGQVVRQRQLWRTRTQTVPVDQIRRIDLRRGITQRLLGVAHVHLYVEGREDPAVKLFGVPDPDAFRQVLLSLGAEDEQVTGAWRK